MRSARSRHGRAGDNAGTSDGRRSVLADRRRLTLAVVVALPLLLASCGQKGQPPAATPAAATVRSGAAGQTPPPASMAASAAAGALAGSQTGAPQTLGELADRIDGAWGSVRSFRSVFVADPSGESVSPASPGAMASPVASPGAETGFTVTREVILPDRQRQIERINGAVVSEAIVVGNRAFVRGATARRLHPGVAETAWVEVDLASVKPIAGTDPLLARLAAPVVSPTRGVPPNLRPQKLRALGNVTVGGRTCQAYGAATTTQIGGRVDLTFAISADGLPCFVESRSGGTGGRETFAAYNLPLTIEAPAVSVPAGSPAMATPVGRD